MRSNRLLALLLTSTTRSRGRSSNPWRPVDRSLITLTIGSCPPWCAPRCLAVVICRNDRSPVKSSASNESRPTGHTILSTGNRCAVSCSQRALWSHLHRYWRQCLPGCGVTANLRHRTDVRLSRGPAHRTRLRFPMPCAESLAPHIHGRSLGSPVLQATDAPWVALRPGVACDLRHSVGQHPGDDWGGQGKGSWLRKHSPLMNCIAH